MYHRSLWKGAMLGGCAFVALLLLICTFCFGPGVGVPVGFLAAPFVLGVLVAWPSLS